jgi:hypothetical protein
VAEPGYEHIFVSEDYSQRMDYTTPRKSRGRPIPRHDVPEHAGRLRRRLDEAWRQAVTGTEERRAVALPTRSGTYLEFRSAPGEELVSKSLESRPAGIRLLSVVEREIDGEEEPATFATVFVPHGKEGHFLRKVQAYQTDRTPKGEPKNRRLVDSIADIRLAMVGSFWTDSVPSPGAEAAWCEAWIRTEIGAEAEAEQRFRRLLGDLGIQATEGSLQFPERTVIQIMASESQLAELIRSSDDVAEFRLAKDTAAFWLDLPNQDQSQAVQDLLSRLEVNDTDVAVCILDTGVNNGHPLLEPVLASEDCHTVQADWGTHDQDGHGTLMGGVAAFGDLHEVLASGHRIRVAHVLESAKILRGPGDENPHELYGYLTAQGISHAEIQAPQRKRIVCLAISSIDDRDAGRPSSWSGEIDALASGASDDTRRLIMVAAGNTAEPDEWQDFPERTLTNEVHDPGQAWNALTVGAWTQKTNIQDPEYADYEPVAPVGSISPFTSTSLTWEDKWPAKPDILMEGGNAALEAGGVCADLDDLALVSTHREPRLRHFAAHNMTSAATALAARMAARLQVAYPDAWPETIRALMVHSAEWTPAMLSAFLEDSSKSSYEKLLRICGYGVPNLERAVRCMRNSLTLVTEREIQPYDRQDGAYKTLDMHVHELPWPSDILLGLGDMEVTLRVTLSYFIEPGPGQIGWRDRYRYASHGLRFELNTPEETREELIVRLNHAAREEGQTPETSSDSARWTIGSNARDRGSVHSDIWRGTAASIARTNLVGVYPVIGWWRERPHLDRWSRRTRYSLVVSLSTEEQNIDIYTPVATEVGILTPIEIEIDGLGG